MTSPSILLLLSFLVVISSPHFETNAFQLAPSRPSFSSTTRIQYHAQATMDPPPLVNDNDVATEKVQPVNERTAPKRIKSSRRPKHVLEVTNLNDYNEVVANERKRLTVVRFYAPWCRACKKVEQKHYRLGTEFPNIKIVEVPVTKDNRGLHQGLDVPAIPYGHIYHPTAGLVEELRITKRKFNDFKKIIASYEDRECILPDLDPVTKMYEAPYERAS